jgi:hypothetical protein
LTRNNAPSPLLTILQTLNKLPEEFELILLNRDKLAPLSLPEPVDFLVERHYFEFCLQIDFIVMLGIEAVPVGLPVLGHQNYGRLNGSQH